MNKPFVSILVPAYNEELSVETTLLSCVNQTYPNYEIIVINDGSKDETPQIVDRFIEDYRLHNVKLINQKNQGKAKALNKGLFHSRGKFVITVDADSKLHHRAIELIMAKFTNNKIGAVAGNVVAISHKKLLSDIQKLEYEISTHFLRESQSVIGSVTITPGAFSAYRKKALKKFEEGTLTEDFDSSLKVLEEGSEIVIAADALCYTQVPLNYTDIIKQRIRWQQGGLEVFSKHLFHEKRFFVSLEMFLIFFFGFYGLFPKILTFMIIPITLFSSDISSYLQGFGLFFIYFSCIWLIKLLIIGEKKLKMYAIVPVFIVYWYTLILYSILAAQIIVFNKDKKWGTLKRYRI